MEFRIKPNLKISILKVNFLFSIIFILSNLLFFLIRNIIINNELKFLNSLIYYLFIIGNIVILYNFIKTIKFWKNGEYIISDKKIEAKFDYLDLYETSINVKKIINIDYKIGWFLDKIFNTGTIRIYTSSSIGADLELNNIQDVSKVYSELTEKLLLKNNLDDNKINLIEVIKPNVKKGNIVGIIWITISFLILFLFAFLPIGVWLLSLGLNAVFYLVIILLTFLLYFVVIFMNKKALEKLEYNFYSDHLEYYDWFLILNKVTIPYDKITNIELNQGFLGRIFSYYNVKLDTAGSLSAEVTLKYIDSGDEILRKIRGIIKNE